ncbi:Uncharacterised protein [Mycobacterium tuberculosis]|nr:Uncharacterised protein [Mycobacterium tuberculosis]
MFSDFFKCTVDITNGRDTTDDTFTVNLDYILEYTVGSRVCRSNIEGYQLILRVIVLKDRCIM